MFTVLVWSGRSRPGRDFEIEWVLHLVPMANSETQHRSTNELGRAAISNIGRPSHEGNWDRIYSGGTHEF